MNSFSINFFKAIPIKTVSLRNIYTFSSLVNEIRLFHSQSLADPVQKAKNSSCGDPWGTIFPALDFHDGRAETQI